MVKSDLDVRDALGLERPGPHISALLDWERVGMGDQCWELVSIQVRFRKMGRHDLWDSFRQGYEASRGRAIPEGCTATAYLFARAAMAAKFGTLDDNAVDLLKSLIG